jgi:hypothetical protein
MILTLSRIDDEGRLTESEVLEKFNRIVPRVLGALLDGVSLALGRMPTLEMHRLPRMADFAKWVTAAETSFGWPTGTFMETYARHLAQLNETALESSPLVEPIKEVCAEGEFLGTAKQLLLLLERISPDIPGMPKAANILSSALTRLSPNLRKIGILVERMQTPGSGSKKLWRIARIEGSGGASLASINE